jgi:hypothetical protein
MGFDRDFVALPASDQVSTLGNEPNVYRSAWRGVRTDDEIGVLTAVLTLPERGISRAARTRSVEGFARLRVAHADLHVVEDDPRPIPLDGHAPTTSRSGR